MTRYSIIGPFDNPDGKLLEKALSARKRRSGSTRCTTGKVGKVAWKPLATSNEYGIVDIAKQINPYKGATMYLLAEFRFAQPRNRRIEAGDAERLEDLAQRETALRPQRISPRQHVRSVSRPGPDACRPKHILLKICQDEEKEDWAQILPVSIASLRYERQRRRSQPVSVSGGPR